MRRQDQLIARIEQDILQRGLAPGDRYLTTREVAKMLNVSTMSAGRALQDLAGRGIVERRQGAGTIIGRTPQEAAPFEMRHVHILTPANYYNFETPLFQGLSAGLHQALPFDSIQVTFLPEYDQASFVRGMLEQDTERSSRSAFVLILSSPQVQQIFLDYGAPAVVLGSVYPGERTLPWINFDAVGMGRALVEHFVARGVTRLACLLRDSMRYGDAEMLDGIQGAWAKAGLPGDALVLRFSPAEASPVGGIVNELIDGPHPPGALLCRSFPLARQALAALETRGLGMKDLPLGVAAEPDGLEPAIYPHVRDGVSAEEHGLLAGEMLKAVAGGKRPDPFSRVLPIELILSEASGHGGEKAYRRQLRETALAE